MRPRKVCPYPMVKWPIFHPHDSFQWFDFTLYPNTHCNQTCECNWLIEMNEWLTSCSQESIIGDQMSRDYVFMWVKRRRQHVLTPDAASAAQNLFKRFVLQTQSVSEERERERESEWEKKRKRQQQMSESGYWQHNQSSLDRHTQHTHTDNIHTFRRKDHPVAVIRHMREEKGYKERRRRKTTSCYSFFFLFALLHLILPAEGRRLLLHLTSLSTPKQCRHKHKNNISSIFSSPSSSSALAPAFSSSSWWWWWWSLTSSSSEWV